MKLVCFDGPYGDVLGGVGVVKIGDNCFIGNKYHNTKRHNYWRQRNHRRMWPSTRCCRKQLFIRRKSCKKDNVDWLVLSKKEEFAISIST